MRLLTSQKNKLFDLISQTNFLQNDFRYWEGTEMVLSGVVDAATITYKKTPEFKYIISKTGAASYFVTCSPGFSTYSEEKYCQTWEDLESDFRRWVKNLEREEDQEDKWETLKTIADSFDASLLILDTEDSREPFSKEQQIEIKKRVALLQTRISESDIPQDQAQQIIERLDHLSKLTETLSKFDWPSQFIGAMVSIVIQLSVSPQNARNLWALIKQIFSGIVFLH